MEVFPYFLSILVTVLAVYWSVREYRRKPGAPISGLFRYQEVLKASAVRTQARAADRSRPWLTPPASPLPGALGKRPPAATRPHR